MIINLTRKEDKYMSWEEYKKRVLEIEVIHMIEKFLEKDNSNSLSNLNAIRITRSDKNGGDKNARNIFEWI